MERESASPPPGSTRNFLGSSWFHCALIGLIALAAYSNSFSVPFQFDDTINIDQSSIRNIGELGQILGSPRVVGYVTLALNYALHGRDVIGYHVFNLAVHILTALLLYAVTVSIFQTPGLTRASLRPQARRLALFSALLFAAHPVQTQAVTYIVQRFASLATFFYLGSVAGYIAFRRSADLNQAAWKRAAWYSLSLLSCILAMKTKEIAFTLPVVLSLCEFMFFEGEAKKRVLLLAPFLLTLLIIPLSLIGSAKPLGDVLSDVSEVTRLETRMSRSHYLFTQFSVIATYLRLLILPYGQNLDYDYPLVQSFFAPQAFLPFLLLASIFCAGLFFSHHGRRTRGNGTVVAFGIFWFFITLSVESSIIPIVDVIFEHRVYLPSAGFFMAGTTALFWGAEKLKIRWAGADRLLAAGLAVAVVLLGVATFARNRVWGSELSLWNDVVRKSPQKVRAYNNRGLAFKRAGRFGEAMEDFQKTIALDPAAFKAYNNIGLLYLNVGLFEKSIEYLNKSIAIDPTYAEAYDNRGVCYASSGRYDLALEDFTKAIELKSGNGPAYFNRAKVYQRTGNQERALADLEKACQFGVQKACGASFSPREQY